MPTRDHKTLDAEWLFELPFTHQGPLYLDSEVAPKSPTFHADKRLVNEYYITKELKNS